MRPVAARAGGSNAVAEHPVRVSVVSAATASAVAASTVDRLRRVAWLPLRCKVRERMKAGRFMKVGYLSKSRFS
ncbi:hypothetical protein GCM10028798_03960 [Humibacter antri]